MCFATSGPTELLSIRNSAFAAGTETGWFDPKQKHKGKDNAATASALGVLGVVLQISASCYGMWFVHAVTSQ